MRLFERAALAAIVLAVLAHYPAWVQEAPLEPVEEPSTESADVPEPSAEQAPEAEQASDPAARLEAASSALAEARLEDALSEIDHVLAEGELTEELRVEALVLRLRALSALGDWDDLERGWKELLTLRPGYAPDPSWTTERARERYERARRAVVGKLLLSVTPADTSVMVDGRPVEPTEDGSVPLTGGDHVLELVRAGYDSEEQPVSIAAGGETKLEVRLVPNARSVLILTEDPGVRVSVDGEEAGVTERGLMRGPAELLLEYLPLGEHEFAMSKDCHRTEVRRELLIVNLTGDEPQRLGPIRLLPAEAALNLRGQPEGSRVFASGRDLGRLPVEAKLCPGTYQIEVRHDTRRVWVGELSLDHAETATVEVVSRPNVALVGFDEWPPELARFRAQYNTVARGLDRATASEGEIAWGAIDLPPDADLVLAPAGVGSTRIAVYSPPLERSITIDAAHASLNPPSTERAVWGIETVDSEIGGPARIVRVVPGGSAAAAGLEAGGRILDLGGAKIERSAQARAILEAARARVPIDVAWQTAEGEMRRARLEARTSPRLEPSRGDLFDDVVRAAWCRADELDPGLRGNVARAGLALLHERWGQNALAIEAWRKVSFEEREGIGQGTAQYHLGRLLMLQGNVDEARRQLEAAAKTQATAFHDDGPPIAPAARDRLALLDEITRQQPPAPSPSQPLSAP